MKRRTMKKRAHAADRRTVILMKRRRGWHELIASTIRHRARLAEKLEILAQNDPIEEMLRRLARLG